MIMQNIFKRLFSLFLSFVMTFGMLAEVSANELQKEQSLSRTTVSSVADIDSEIIGSENLLNAEEVLEANKVIEGDLEEDLEEDLKEGLEGNKVLEEDLEKGLEGNKVTEESLEGNKVIEENLVDISNQTEEQIINQNEIVKEPEITAETNNLLQMATDIVTDESFSGEGNEASPFMIDSAEKIVYLTKTMSSGKSIKGVLAITAFYKLECDIDLSNMTDFSGIGSRHFSFQGDFDGNGHTVNLKIVTENRGFTGLFGNSSNATIKNVTVLGSVIANGSSDYVAGIVGYAEKTLIENCINEAYITCEDGTGGIVGLAIDSTITESENRGIIQTVKTRVGSSTGGIAGGIVNTIIESSSNSGQVMGRYSTGGIVGAMNSSSVLKSKNSGELNGISSRNGGIAGEVLANSLISECEVTDQATVIGGRYIGGIAGSLTNSKIIKSNFFGDLKGLYSSASTGYDVCGSGIVSTVIGISSIEDCLVYGKISTDNNDIIVGELHVNSSLTMKNTYYKNDTFVKNGNLNFFGKSENQTNLTVENSGYYVKGTITPNDADIIINGVKCDESLIERNGNEFLVKVQLNKKQNEPLPQISKVSFSKYGYETKELDLYKTEPKSYQYNFDLGEISLTKIPLEDDTTAPIAKAGYNKTSIVGVENEFDASQSSDNDEIASYDWDFGDGKTATGVKATNTYEKAGEYTVTLKVKDRFGNESSDSIVVKVFEQSQVGTIIIKVVDSQTNAPIPNANVYVDFPDKPIIVTTNAKGEVSIIGEPGNYNFSAYKKNYLPKEQNEKITQYETTNATIAIEKSEISVGSVVTRPLSIDEIVALGIDTNAPQNQHVYSYTVTLEFGKEKIDMPLLIGNGYGGFLGGGTGWHIPGFGGALYPNLISIPDHPEIPPSLVVLKISNSVSFLKEFFEVSIMMQNMADYQFILKDSKVSLDLPKGLSLADTGFNQTLEQSLGDIAGGQVQFASWIVKGDTVGEYHINADFKAILMPFLAPITSKFKTEKPLKVQGGDGLKIYVSPETVAHPGEPYYVEFTLKNESSREFYNVKTKFKAKEGNTTPRKNTIMTEDGPVEISQPYFDYFLANVEDQQGLPFLEDGDGFEVGVLKPGESISSTYTTILDEGDDPEKIIYKLRNAFSQTDAGSTVEIPVVFTSVPLNVSGNPNDAPNKWNFNSDGVDLATGANVVDASTVDIFGVKDIPFKLKNNSMDLEKGRFGQGWSSNYDLKVKPQSDGSIRVYTTNTSYIRFVNDNATKGIVNGSIKDSKISVKGTGSQGTYSCLTTNYQRYKLTKETDGYFVTDDQNNVYYFDKDGKLNRTKDKKGRALEVNAEEQKITVREASTNKEIEATSNDQGQITRIADNAGKEATLTYNGAGQIETITNAVGDKTTYEYNPEGRLIHQMINNSDVMTIAYDEFGRVTKKTDAMGESITYTYDDKSEFWRTLISITDRNGNTELVKSDWRGQIVSMKNALGEETFLTYNKYGDNTSVRDALDNSTIYTYDTDGNVLKIEDAEGIVETMTYDSHGNMLSHEMENGSKTINTYSDKNLLLKTTDERGATATFTYNDDAQVLTKTVEGLGTSHYSYESGKLKSETDFLGNVTTYEYDASGNRTSQTDAEGNTTTYKYDKKNRLLETTTADSATTSYKYDDRDNVIEITDPLKKVTKQTFDANNRLKTVTDTMSQTTQYEYDKERNLIKGINPDGGIFSYKYDAVYRLKETEDAEGLKTGYEYDRVGQLKSKTVYNEGKDGKYTYEYYRNGSLKTEQTH